MNLLVPMSSSYSFPSQNKCPTLFLLLSNIPSTSFSLSATLLTNSWSFSQSSISSPSNKCMSCSVCIPMQVLYWSKFLMDVNCWSFLIDWWISSSNLPSFCFMSEGRSIYTLHSSWTIGSVATSRSVLLTEVEGFDAIEQSMILVISWIRFLFAYRANKSGFF